MSRYKEHRGPKRRGYDEDYSPDYHAAERQPEYFSPRPTLTQGSEPSRQASNGSTPTRASDLSLWQADPTRSCPRER
jgi:hypothetical protein